MRASIYTPQITHMINGNTHACSFHPPAHVAMHGVHGFREECPRRETGFLACPCEQTAPFDCLLGNILDPRHYEPRYVL
jgi:hypothetical protein